MEGKGNYLTLKEAAKHFGVHPNTLRNWDRRGVIRLEQLPGSRYRRVSESEVERLTSTMETGLPDFSSDRWVRSGRSLILLPPPEEGPPAHDVQPTHSTSWSVRIEPPDPDPEAIAAGQALEREIHALLAQSEPEQTLEEVMQSLRGWSWL